MVMAIFDTNQAKVHVYIGWLWIKEKIAFSINFIVAQIQHFKHNSIICNDYQKTSRSSSCPFHQEACKTVLSLQRTFKHSRTW